MKTSRLVVLTTALWFATSAVAQVTALTHATVIDGTGAAPQHDVTILMDNGRIREMESSSRITVPAGAGVLDVSGKFIVPGIINAHGVRVADRGAWVFFAAVADRGRGAQVRNRSLVAQAAARGMDRRAAWKCVHGCP